MIKKQPAALFAVLAVLAILATVLMPVPASAQAVPDAPTNLQASAVTHNSVTLSWDDPADSSITGYEILRRDVVNQAAGVFTTIEADTGSTATTYIDSTVAASTHYVYRIKAHNAAGTSPQSGYVNVTTDDAPADTDGDTDDPGQDPPADGDVIDVVVVPPPAEEPLQTAAQTQCGRDTDPLRATLTVGQSGTRFGFSRLGFNTGSLSSIVISGIAAAGDNDTELQELFFDVNNKELSLKFSSQNTNVHELALYIGEDGYDLASFSDIDSADFKITRTLDSTPDWAVVGTQHCLRLRLLGAVCITLGDADTAQATLPSHLRANNTALAIIAVNNNYCEYNITSGRKFIGFPAQKGRSYSIDIRFRGGWETVTTWATTNDTNNFRHPWIRRLVDSTGLSLPSGWHLNPYCWTSGGNDFCRDYRHGAVEVDVTAHNDGHIFFELGSVYGLWSFSGNVATQGWDVAVRVADRG